MQYLFYVYLFICPLIYLLYQFEGLLYNGNELLMKKTNYDKKGHINSRWVFCLDFFFMSLYVGLLHLSSALHVCVYVCVCVRVCMCMRVCLCICIYSYVNVSMHTGIYICEYAHIYCIQNPEN